MYHYVYNVGDTFKDAEARIITATLIHFGGCVTFTAESLKMDRNRLYRRIEEYRIDLAAIRNKRLCSVAQLRASEVSGPAKVVGETPTAAP